MMTTIQSPPVRLVPARLISVTAPRRQRVPLWRRILRALALLALFLVLAAVVGPVGPTVEDDLAAAARARAVFRYDRALDWYATATAASPDDPRPQCLVGEVRALQHEWQSAIAAYHRCLVLHPHDPAAAWLGLGDALEGPFNAQGTAPDAEAAWQRSAALGGRTALRRLGLYYERLGRFADAGATWARLPTSDPQALVHLGLSALWHGDLTTARRDFLAARATPNQYTEVLAENGFLTLAALPTMNGGLRGRLGFAFLGAGMTHYALDPLRAAVRSDPTDGSAHAYLGWTLWLLGQPKEAQAEVTQGLRLSPRLSFAWFATGEMAIAAGNLQAAEQDYQQAIKLAPNNPTLRLGAGRLELARSNYLAAELDYDTAAQLSTRPDESVALLRFYVDHGLQVSIGVDHGIGFTADRARAASIAAVSRWPNSEPIRFLSAQIEDQRGRVDMASSAAHQAIALDPTDPGPYVLLGRYAANAGSYVAAALQLRVALALEPHGQWAEQAATLLAGLTSVTV